MAEHPYQNLPETAFWRPAVAERHVFTWQNLWEPLKLGAEDKVATAGSCFAQHIGRHLRKRKVAYLDLEPAPSSLSADERLRHGFGIYSCRYGNIYTTRQLLQIVQEALDERRPADVVWQSHGRYFDGIRPSVDPVGHRDADTVLALRAAHLRKVREMLETLDVFVFTMGLTEVWVSNQDGTAYPTAPGTIVGEFDPSRYRLLNLRYGDIYADLNAFRERLKSLNPKARILLTVSPVPITATASGKHVLLATTRTKTTLRAVAGDFADDHEDVSYFPGYELVASHPSRAMFFDPNLRTVTDAGVQFVMSHFFAENYAAHSPNEEDARIVCDEELLDEQAA